VTLIFSTEGVVAFCPTALRGVALTQLDTLDFLFGSVPLSQKGARPPDHHYARKQALDSRTNANDYSEIIRQD
jgi:hypothetical protein